MLRSTTPNVGFQSHRNSEKMEVTPWLSEMRTTTQKLGIKKDKITDDLEESNCENNKANELSLLSLNVTALRPHPCRERRN